MKTALLAATTVLLLAGCGSAPPIASAASLPTMAVDTAIATAKPHTTVELIPGTVRAGTAATLMARISGAVGRIDATPGRMVAPGTVLLEIDAQEMTARRDQARALAAQGAADFARATLLFDKQAQTKADFDAAQARAAGSAAAASEAEIMLGYTRIAAPFAGVVVRRFVEVGDLLSPGRPVIELEDPASLRLEVEIPESLAARIALGTTLRARIDAAGIDADATVVEVTPAADPVSRTVLAKLALPAGAKDLRSGQFGRVAVPVAAGSLLSIPAAAVVQRGQLDIVFVVQDGRARMRLVRLGGSMGDAVAIRAGLADGETVVAAGAAALRDGQPVTAR